jgi:hypothetical protein
MDAESLEERASPLALIRVVRWSPGLVLAEVRLDPGDPGQEGIEWLGTPTPRFVRLER